MAGFSGDYVDAFGYAQFFTSTALLGLPVLVLVWLASRIQKVGGACFICPYSYQINSKS